MLFFEYTSSFLEEVCHNFEDFAAHLLMCLCFNCASSTNPFVSVWVWFAHGFDNFFWTCCTTFQKNYVHCLE
jgi:hypothetical protein